MPFVAPSLQEIPLENNPRAFEFAEKLLRAEIDILVLLTGAGTRALVEVLKIRYPLEKIVSQLQTVKLVIRGPKPRAALAELGLKPDFAAAEPNTWKEILVIFDRDLPVQGKRIAVQEYGVSNQPFLEDLAKRGAKIFAVPVYRWALPENIQPMEEAIRRIAGGAADAVIWTNAQQIHHVLEISRRMKMEKEFRSAMGGVFTASIGPTMTETLKDHGFSVDFEPSQSKMGILVLELADRSNLIRQK